MTIGFKKMAELVEEEVQKLPSMSGDQKKLLADLCRKLYMLEAGSRYSMGAQRLLEQMRQEIANVADQLAKKVSN